MPQVWGIKISSSGETTIESVTREASDDVGKEAIPEGLTGSGRAFVVRVTDGCGSDEYCRDIWR